MPSENLPYLFAAYSVTWVVFFIYVFFVSRRQREMEKQIEELKRAVELAEHSEEPYVPSDD